MQVGAAEKTRKRIGITRSKTLPAGFRSHLDLFEYV
jgi:hypothetical protein